MTVENVGGSGDQGMKVFRSTDYEHVEALKDALGWNFWTEKGPLAEVRSIISEVERDGDRALLALTRRLDGVDLEKKGLRVGRTDIDSAVRKVESSAAEAIKAAVRSVTAFHRRERWESQFWETAEGVRVGQMIRPLHRIGAYVPGGSASYPSTAVMTVVPAKVAGVHEIAVCVPPGENGEISPYTLYALNLLGVKEIYRLGGAQAVAALALGTETIAGVEKIVGPGNLYVTLAKKEVFGRVGIDMLAGPSELVVLADGEVNCDDLAVDMLAQMEHGSGARSCLVTTSEKVAAETDKALAGALAGRQERQAGEAACAIVRDMEEGVELVNMLAPEHLQIISDDLTGTLSRVHNAGAIYLGPESPVALGDYLVGVNHVLPTAGASRYASPLGVYDFVKRSNVVFSNPRSNRSLSALVESLAVVEGMTWHAESVRRRLHSQ